MDVLLVDRSQALRSRLARLLLETSGMRVVGEAETAAEAREAARRCSPDAVIIDLLLEGGGGYDLLRELRAGQPSPYLVVLTQDPSETYRDRCLEVADMCLDKADDMAVLVRALEHRDAVAGTGRAEPVRAHIGAGRS